MRSSLTLFQRGMLIASAMLLFQLCFLGAVWKSLADAENQIDEDRRVRSAILRLTRLSNLRQSLTTSMVKSADEPDNQACLDDARCKFDQILAEQNKMTELVSHESEKESQNIVWLGKILKQAPALLKEAKSSWIEERNLDHLKALYSLKVLSDSASARIERSLNYFKKREEQGVTRQAKTQQFLENCLISGVILNLVLALFLLLFFVRSIVVRLRTLADNSLRLAAGEPLHERLSGSDEIADLDAAFHKMAETLSGSRSAERTQIENAVNVILSIDAEGKFTAVSPASLSVWGYYPDELLGRRYSDLVMPDRRAATRATIADIMHSGALTAFETKIMPREGPPVDMLWSAYWSETEKSLFCISHDLTERKRIEELLSLSEERARSMLEYLPFSVITVDQAGSIRSVNQRTEQMFQYSRDQLTGRSLSDLLIVDNNEADLDLMEQLRALTRYRSAELDARSCSGKSFPVELSLTRIEKEGAVYELVQIQDISQRREAQRQKEQFVGMVQEGLSAPLASIEGSLSSVARGSFGDISEKAAENISVARRNLSYVVNLMNGLLNLEQFGSGQMALNLAPTEISSVVERSLDAVRPLAEKRQIKLTAETESAVIDADQNYLLQVLINLVSNALKFSPSGKSVTVATRRNAEMLELEVRDEGRGIPAEKLQTIFQRFEQVEIADASQKGGTGLGLSICKTIIEEHGGTIDVFSEVGKGSTFLIRIPMASTAAL